jgi:glycine/D-amino acid oxidase-like deaminating enzyme
MKRYDVKAVAEVAAFEDAHVQIIADLVKKDNVDCDFTMTKSFDVFTDIKRAEAAKKAHAVLKAQGVAKSTIDGVTWTESDRAEEVSGVKGAVGCFSFPAAHLWPYKLMMHFLSVAVSKGLNLQTNTLVTTLSSTAGQWTATTERGTITARKVIVATNGYTSGILPEYTKKILPARGICSRIVVPPGSKHPPLTSTYGLRLPGNGFDYLIPRNDSSIIVGGGRSTFRTHRDQWHNVTDDSTLIEAAENYFDG